VTISIATPVIQRSLAIPVSHACPLCGQPLDPVIARFQRDLEARVLHRLEAVHPKWKPGDGICPDCVFEAVRQMRAERTESAIQGALPLPFPLNGRGDAHLLPTPLRVNAHPNYTGRGVTIAFLPVGESKVELVAPTDGSTGVARFLEDRGEGFHHVCFEVDDIDVALRDLAGRGVKVIDQAARRGAEGPVAFLHPRSCHGVLVELIEAPGGPAWARLGYEGASPIG